MPRKTPRRAKFPGELAPMVPRRLTGIEKFLHPPKGTEQPKEVPTRTQNGTKPSKWKPKHLRPKPRVATFQIYKPSYWDFDLVPKRRNLMKKDRQKKPKRIQKLRPSLTPGTVVIILTGRHKAKRAVFLKQLKDTGNLLLCGPKRLNGIKLMRIPQAFVIATKTKISFEGRKIRTPFKGKKHSISLEKRISLVKDKWFTEEKNWIQHKEWKKWKSTKGKQFLSQFRNGKIKKLPRTMMLHLASREINKAVYQCVKKGDAHYLLQQYLSSKFRLQPKDKPHEMVF